MKFGVVSRDLVGSMSSSLRLLGRVLAVSTANVARRWGKDRTLADPPRIAE